MVQMIWTERHREEQTEAANAGIIGKRLTHHQSNDKASSV